MDKNKPLICSHRGITEHYQENTIDAIKAAADMNLDMVEFDTQVTKDGVWVLHHNLHIQDEETLIKNLRYDEFLELAEQEGKNIDVLDDLLQHMSGIHLNIECKSEAYEAGYTLAEKIEELDYHGDFNISSFSRPALKGLHSGNPGLTLSYLGYYVPLFRWYLLNRKVPLFSINPYIKLVHRLKVKSAHRRGLEVHVWTVNEEEEIRKCLRIGVDVIITDNPEKVKELKSQYMVKTA